ncbi:putative translation elongation factor eEF-1 subunit gamma [Aspergillus saccharolyticus JOP 1030-1]|uniref:Translation elongation factor eEF-1 subunit gamma n=1 Tax=Aspergillus saccharolyticus JOP 1030-1 TaxID=1450539 RepID=A0A318ZNY2_9EURO|nr:translation elongation factor eEF-1 subunit gamma [Aspergillus saccharolyticus JOP 1030-1]PYH48234.1 translation elongation factor eEF-1 subunit gamma [Aspergillus saccharolyticus JOP 1030-1]
MAFGKLYGTAENARTIAILVAAKANDVELELVKTEPNSSSEFNSSAAYRRIQPLGKIPAFEGANGYTLSEAIAIAVYVTSQNEKTTLLGKTKQDYASILRWLSFANAEMMPRFASWFRPLLGFEPYNKKNVEDAQKVALKNAGVLETHLTANTFLVGERISLADFFVAALCTRFFSTVLDKKFRDEHVSFVRWYKTIINQPAFKAVVENPVFVEEAIKYTPPKKEEKPKAAPAPAAAAPAAEEKPAEEKKPKHPLEALGRPTFVLDDLKRTYSNEDTRPVALPWFWANYKPEEFSLWSVNYKYNNELKLTFMANNLIGGFHNRLEASRKYLFGSQQVYGTNYDCVIRGVFLVRGQEFKPAFDVAPDWESYDFVKLDHTNEADRKLVEDMWAWDVPVVIDGKEYPFADGHVFK